jgi:hypothetical protein
MLQLTLTPFRRAYSIASLPLICGQLSALIVCRLGSLSTSILMLAPEMEVWLMSMLFRPVLCLSRASISSSSHGALAMSRCSSAGVRMRGERANRLVLGDLKRPGLCESCGRPWMVNDWSGLASSIVLTSSSESVYQSRSSSSLSGCRPSRFTKVKCVSAGSLERNNAGASESRSRIEHGYSTDSLCNVGGN